MDINIRKCQWADQQCVIELWKRVFKPKDYHNEPDLSFEKKMQFDDMFFVAVVKETIIGTILTGYDGHRGWIYSLAMDKEYRNRGVGYSLVNKALYELKKLGCLKVNLQITGKNDELVEFYEKIGFQVEDRISMGKRLYLLD